MEVVVNAAMSADGKLSTVDRRQVTISGERDFDRVDALRSNVDGILVGSGTVHADNPRLTVKSTQRQTTREQCGKPPHPARIVASSTGKIPATSHILDDLGQSYVLVSEQAHPEDLAKLRSDTTDIISAGTESVDLLTSLYILEEHGIERLLVEGGGELLASLFEEQLVDSLQVYIGNMILGGADAPTLVDGSGFIKEDEFPDLHLRSIDSIDEGALLMWDIHHE